MFNWIFKRIDLSAVCILYALDALINPKRSADILTRSMLDAHLNGMFPLDPETVRLLHSAHFKDYTDGSHGGDTK